MDHRSGLVNIFSAIRSLPQGHDKPVKQALYNTVALFLLIVCCAAGCALYIIFQSFVKPLMWALLVGSTLHPLKRSLRDRFQTWFQNLEINNTPIVFGVILVPVNIVNDVSDFIGKHLWKRLKLIIVIGIIVPIILLIYHYTPKIIVKILWRFVLLTFRTINCFIDASSIWIVGLILIAYISMVFLLWRCDNNKKFHYSSIVIWIFGSSCLAKQFGYYQLPVFILLQIVIFGGFISEVYEHYKTMKESGQPITLPESLSQVFHESHVIEEEIVDSGKEDVEEDDIVTLPEEKKEEMTSIKDKSKDPLSLDLFESTNPIINQKPKLLKRSLSQPYFSSKIIGDSALRYGKKNSYSHTSLIDTESCSSTFYLITVMWACIVMFFWKNLMFLLLLPFPILYYIIKHLGYYIGLWSYLYEKVCDIFEKIASWCHERHDALVPVPIRGLYNIIHKLNSFLKNAVKNGIDTVASCVVIFGLIIFLICTSVFIAFQIYAEAIMLVEMTGSLINQTIVHNPEIKQLLPPSYYNVDAFLDNTYKYGREGISHIVKGSMSNVDSTESKQLEKQILELWDRVYQNWMSSNDTHGPKVTDEAVILTWNDFIENLQKSPEMFNINGLIEFGQQNIGTLMSLLESVLGILKGNISLIFGSFTTLITVILEGGTAVINFSISLVVFFTALFYLLHSSGDHYKPVELLTNFSPSGMRLGHALEGAIIGVFSATFKMTAFYGMWTWFIHNLFGIRIVYLPTVFAAILGAVPFLGTYWAGVPAILNLWLAQDRGIEAIIFAVFQILPTSVVDTTIYKEIKGGGHPYLTGLAIAGGIISLGIEGAIIGPMLLCGLYVAIDLSSTLFKETPSEEVINLRLRQLQNT